MSTELKHSYFKSDEHYINYCRLILRNKNVSQSIIDDVDLRLLVWTIIHENIFKQIGVKPPHHIFTIIIREDNPIKSINKFKDEVLTELWDLSTGNKPIEDCTNIMQYRVAVKEDEFPYAGIDKFTKHIIDFNKKNADSCGVYKLYNRDKKIIYIGKSYHIGKRILTSTRERKAYFYNYCLTKSRADTDLLEIYLILTEKPHLNGDSTTLDNLTIKVEHKYRFGKIAPIFKDIK